MSFRYIDSKALRIPGRMDLDELAFLATLAAQVPRDGHIVEVGAFYGRSTNAMAQANPAAKITSIDTFENVDWTERYANQYHEVPVFGRDAFDHFTSGLDNVSPIQGFSPDCVHDWTHPIDMYFEDAIHGNPGLKRNLDFWIGHLKPGGIACGHDYTRRFPDIKAEVDSRASYWGCEVAVVGSLWALRKPVLDPSRPPLSELQISNAPVLSVQTCNKKKGNMTAQNGYWCGAHLDADRLNWVQIDDIALKTGLKLEYRLGHPHFGSTDWVSAGQKAQLVYHNKARSFTRFAARLCGVQEGPSYHLNYRISARQIGNGGARLSGTSPWACDGDWAALPIEGPAANAIAIDLSETLPPKPQSAFTKRPRTLWQDLKKALDRKVLTRA